MTNKDILTAVAINTGYDAKAVKEVVDSYLATIKAAIEHGNDGDKIPLNGLGSFAISTLPDRTVRNPKTNEEISKKASYKLKFTVSGKLKKDVSNRLV